MSQVLKTRICILCEKPKPVDEFSIEHIWPRSLGGDLLGEAFETNGVCKRCNEVMGQWVDAAFTKSWFVQNARAQLAWRFLNPAKPKIVPFVFLSHQENVVLKEGEVCERWSGPAGEHAYWFHQEDDDRWLGYAGGDFFRRRSIDPGKAYLALTAQEPYWSIMAMASFVIQFKHAKRFMLSRVGGLEEHYPELAKVLPPLASKDDHEHEEFLKWHDERHASRKYTINGGLQLRWDFDHRFTAKLGFELGYKFLGPKYLDTNYAKSLRRVARERDLQTRLTHGMLGSAFIEHEDTSEAKLLCWELGWVLIIATNENGLGVFLHFPTGQSVTVQITDEPALFREELEKFKAGQVIVVVPDEGLVAGPMSLREYLSHRQGGRKNPQMQAIEQASTDISQLPPKSLTDGTH